MLVNIIKFIHVVTTLALLGMTGYCLILVCARKWVGSSFVSVPTFKRYNQFLIGVLLLAVLTGSMLVYPKHFTFHTPWIQAAYLLVSVFFLTTLTSFFFHRKGYIKMAALLYFPLVGILIIVIHDAVSKATFLF